MAVSADAKSAADEALTLAQPPAEIKKKSKKTKDSKSADKAEKSSKKKRKTADSPAAAISDEQPKKKKKKAKTEAAHSSSDSEDTTVAGAAPAVSAAPPTVTPAVPAEPANPLALDNFRLSAPIKSLLRAKNMETLFDIQAQTLNFCLDGFDLVGRARTGCGKTLAFVLPIIERLSQGYDGGKRAFGRGPRVIVLAPTRELAKQVNNRAYSPIILQCLSLSTPLTYKTLVCGSCQAALSADSDNQRCTFQPCAASYSQDVYKAQLTDLWQQTLTAFTAC